MFFLLLFLSRALYVQANLIFSAEKLSGLQSYWIFYKLILRALQDTVYQLQIDIASLQDTAYFPDGLCGSLQDIEYILYFQNFIMGCKCLLF